MSDDVTVGGEREWINTRVREASRPGPHCAQEWSRGLWPELRERQYNYGDGPQKMMHIQDLGQRIGGKLVYNHQRMLHQAPRPFVIRWANIAPCDGLTPDNLLSRDTRRGSREVVIFLSRHMMYCHSAAIITIFRHNQLKVVFSSLGIKILLSKYRDIKYLESKILLTGILIISEYLFVGKVNIVLQRRRL